MKVVTPEEFKRRKREFIDRIRMGSVFMYPTDTIYGIGCNAEDERAVLKIRKIKNQFDQPFSVVAPSKDWIFENCEILPSAMEWIDKLPGPFTLIIRMMDEALVARNVSPGSNTLGVRIPKNWFSTVVAELKLPIISTSANIHGQKHMTSLSDLEPEVKEAVEFIIYEGSKKSSPSQIIDLTTVTHKVIKH